MDATSRRSFADPLSSTIFVGKLDLQKWTNDLAMMRRFPLTALPQLLHESTHHWCFNSPVGLTLQLLSFRAANRQIGAMAEGYNSRESALSLFKVRFWQHLMLPFTEGLALFAEHDALLGDAPNISEPLRSVASLVAGTLTKNIVDTDSLLEHSTYILSLSRNSTEHYDRKTNLLLEPFGSTRSPYLCGYLTVKCLHFEAIRRNGIFVDSDFFMHFLKSFLFDDWDLVGLLLSEADDDPEKIADGFCKHLEKRFLGFFDAVEKLSVDEFSKRGLNRTGERELFVYSTGRVVINLYSDPVGPLPSAEVTGAFRVGLDELFKPTPDEHETVEVVRSVHMSTFLIRNLLTLGRTVFPASVASPSGRIMIWSQPGKLLTSFTPYKKKFPEGWEGELTVVLVLMPETGQIHLAYLDNDTVIQIVPEVSENEVFEPLTSPMIDPNIRSHNLRVLEYVTEVPSKMADQWFDEIIEYRADQVESFYTYAAFLFIEEADTLAAILANGSLLDLLDGDLGLVEHLGCLSSAACTKYSPTAGSEAERRLVTAMAFAQQINQKLKDRFNFEPLILSGDEIIFSLF